MAASKKLGALVAVALVAGLLVTRPWDRSSGPPDATVWQNITSQISDGRMSKDGALQAFAFLHQVDIPGVEIPEGTDGDDHPTSGSGVARWVNAHWDDLEPAQREVIDDTLALGPDDVVVDIDFAAGTVQGQGRGEVGADDCPKDDAMVQAICADVLRAIAEIGPLLGIPTIKPGTGLVSMKQVKVAVSEKDGGTAYAETHPADTPLGDYSPCYIVVWKNGWGSVAPGDVATSVLHEVLTHEVVHCYQNVIWGSVAVHRVMPAWITEGTALWLASDHTHIEETMVASQWRVGWLGRPRESLFDRSYDAFGFYALLDTHNFDLWRDMAAAWRIAAASPGSPSVPFLKALDGDDLEIRQAWAPSLMRRPQWGKAWETFGFGLPGDARAPRIDLTALRAVAPRHLRAYAAEVTEVTGTAGEIVIVDTDGLAAAHDDANHALFSFQHERLCTTKSCVCPAGTERAGENMAETRMDIPFQLAFSAPAAGADSTVTARTLAEECGLDEPPVPTPVGGGGPPGADLCPGGCASSNGDPHLRTVDNQAYDFQAVGEFVLLRDPDAGVELQVRQTAYGEHASVNTAVVARAGGRRLGFYMVDNLMETRVDGVVTGSDPGVTQLELDDGTTVWLLPHGQYGIVLQVGPSEELRADGAGLLGPVPPGGAGLPLLADGTQLPRPKSVEERHQFLYERFADSWRVTDATSLFDYEAGQSTADFTDRDFPTEADDTSIAALPNETVAGAMEACADVTDSTLWLQCVYDVGVTGNAGFAELYAMAQALIEDGAAAVDVEPPAPRHRPGRPSTARSRRSSPGSAPCSARAWPTTARCTCRCNWRTIATRS